MYSSGNKTYREIATWLNQSVHETRSRRRDADQRRYLWTRYSVSGILTNPFYLGQVRHEMFSSFSSLYLARPPKQGCLAGKRISSPF
jgi:hypothetical protein